ncbi:MAG: adenylate kinase [Actinomycetota bacterium]
MVRRLMILGPPGGGKGTLAERLGEHLSVPHISTGAMLRAEVAESSDLGRRAQGFMKDGRLVPDDLVTEMVLRRLAEPDAPDGWILDGFPRNLNQAQAMDRDLGDSRAEAVLVLEVPDEEVFVRIAGRRTCPNGHVYNLTKNPPRTPGVCDVDGEPLQQREDASEDVIRDRLQIYRRETVPVLEFYDRKGILHRLDGTGEPDEVYARVIDVLREAGRSRG